MAQLKILREDEQITTNFDTIHKFMTSHGIKFGRFELNELAKTLAKKDTLSDEERNELLDSYQHISSEFEQQDGYKRDVVCLWPEFEHIDFILNKFGDVHYHFNHEFWYFFDGQFDFIFCGNDGRKFCITVEAGEYLQVPEGFWQLFSGDRNCRMKSMRFFYTTHSVKQPEEVALA